MIPKDTKKQILSTVKHLGKASVTDIIKNLPERKSRQWISMLLTEMHERGELARAKSGKFVYYVLPERLDLLGKKISESMANKNINEDFVFENLSNASTFIKVLPENVNSILRYAFTEMVNNVRDHSRSERLKVSIEETDKNIAFEVFDDGVGVFTNIMQKKQLNSELEAIQELLKGKTTTIPHSHSGEGIFFTSKIADIFVLDSFEYRLRVDNTISDVFIEKIAPIKGTKVNFELNKSTKKHLSDVFYEYEAEPGSFAFDKTQVQVKLFKAGTVYISRSQAKRLLANLDKFALIILDFQGIETVGQAFADEVFRVFESNHTNIKIEAINMSETVAFMINRVAKPEPKIFPDKKSE
jgi:uncharacterized protein DUF4325/penicillinase repressor